MKVTSEMIKEDEVGFRRARVFQSMGIKRHLRELFGNTLDIDVEVSASSSEQEDNPEEHDETHTKQSAKLSKSHKGDNTTTFRHHGGTTHVGDVSARTPFSAKRGERESVFTRGGGQTEADNHA